MSSDDADDVRVARFKELQPQRAYTPDADVWRPGDSMTPRSVYLLMGPSRSGPRAFAQPAITGDHGTEVCIVECAPGARAVLPTFMHARETFMCLRGRFRGRWGEHGEQETVLEPFDLITMPPAVCREFTNVSDDSAFLLVMLTTPVEEPKPEAEPALPVDRFQTVARLAQAAIDAASRLEIPASLRAQGRRTIGAIAAAVVLLIVLRWTPSRPPMPPAPVRVDVASPVAPRTDVATAAPLAPVTAQGPAAVPAAVLRPAVDLVRAAPPAIGPAGRTSESPTITGPDGAVTLGNFYVGVQRAPRREGKGRVVDYTIRILTSDGTPVTTADVRLRVQTVEGSTLEARIEPAPTSGLYQAAVNVPPGGFRQAALEIVPPDTLWESLQRLVGAAGPQIVHTVKLRG